MLKVFFNLAAAIGCFIGLVFLVYIAALTALSLLSIYILGVVLGFFGSSYLDWGLIFRIFAILVVVLMLSVNILKAVLLTK